MFKNRIIILILSFFFLLPFPVFASILTLTPDQGSHNVGDEFAVEIRLDVGENCINTVEGTVVFPEESVQLVDFSVGESILSLWVERPTTNDIAAINKSGLINFSGGIPGGYCGRIPGDPGQSNLIGKLYFKGVPFSVNDGESKEIEVKFEEPTQVLINDGLGTKDDLVVKGGKYTIASNNLLPVSDWEQALKADKISPEPFVIELLKGNAASGGRYYIMFSTTDKQSGLDHYEVMEKPVEQAVSSGGIFSWLEDLMRGNRPEPQWIIAEPPYILNDQSLKSTIKVKAVDKAGNERTVEFIPSELPANAARDIVKFRIMVILILLISITMLWIILHKYLASRRKHDDAQKQ